jgi:alkylation response protein AidB-like acyl-CoA dehydrogenase
MDFDFSDDQQQLRDAVRKWVDKGYAFERRRGIVAAGGFDRAAYGELAELGLTALTVPEQHDGMGQDTQSHRMVPYWLATLYQKCNPAWLPSIANGEAMVVLAHQERGARYKTDTSTAKSTLAQDGYRLTAIKNIVPCR